MTTNTHKHSIAGHCHCENITYVLNTDTSINDVTLRICRCDFCLRHRPRYWSDPKGMLEVSFERMDDVARYRFGHGTADFVLCRACGVFAFAVTEVDGNHYAVTNLNLALDRKSALPETFIEALSENETERTTRRARNWTPVSGQWPPSGARESR